MKYINLLFVLLLLSSCATTDNPPNSQVDVPSQYAQSDDEIRRFKIATELLNSNELDKAKEIFMSLNNDRPDLSGPYANLAIIALKNNKPNKALELVNIALLKNPNLAQALNLLAYLEQIKGDINSAEKHYKQAIKSKPSYSLAHYNLALLYDVYFQDINSAIPHYERYMQLINGKDKSTADWLEQIKRKKEKG